MEGRKCQEVAETRPWTRHIVQPSSPCRPLPASRTTVRRSRSDAIYSFRRLQVVLLITVISIWSAAPGGRSLLLLVLLVLLQFLRLIAAGAAGELRPDEAVHVESGMIGCRVHDLLILGRVFLIRIGHRLVVFRNFIFKFDRRYRQVALWLGRWQRDSRWLLLHWRDYRLLLLLKTRQRDTRRVAETDTTTGTHGRRKMNGRILRSETGEIQKQTGSDQKWSRPDGPLQEFEKARHCSNQNVTRRRPLVSPQYRIPQDDVAAAFSQEARRGWHQPAVDPAGGQLLPSLLKAVACLLGLETNLLALWYFDARAHPHSAQTRPAFCPHLILR